MKYHLGFFGILAGILCLVGYLTMTFNAQVLFYLHGSDDDVEQILSSFRQSYKPELEINFSALYGGNGQFQVLHPMLDMRSFRITPMPRYCQGPGSDPKKQIAGTRAGWASRLALESQSLKENFSRDFKTKAEALEYFLNYGAKLPENFMTSPPFVHNSGHSFALFLVKKMPDRFGQRDWVQQHLSFFRISELKEVIEKFQINSREFSLISWLGDAEIEEVIRASPVVLTKDFVLVKNQTRFGFSPLSYWIYKIQDLQVELKKGKYELVPYTSDAVCLQHIGNACWTYNSKHALGYLYKYSLGLLVFIGLVFFISFSVYLKHLIDKNREQKKHRLSLQVLSHEFRTPVSSMLLIIEQLTQDSSRFKLADQDLLIRMSTEAFRLQRIIEVSKSYLQAEGRRVQFRVVEIPSINQWICDFVSESNLNIQCELLAVDQAINADPFWLKFVISNLVQNAFAHGAEPVFIRLRASRKGLKIVVEDHGVCEFNSFRQMSDAFLKSSRSKGMGLGLNIAKFIVNEWGSEIKFSKSPTAFTLSLVDRKANG